MINIVKLQSNGYLVNGSLSVPNDPANRDYQEVQKWLEEGNTPEPEYTQAELDEQANQKEYALLNELDRKSIRDIREWIAAQTDAPQTLKDREQEAVQARGRLK